MKAKSLFSLFILMMLLANCKQQVCSVSWQRVNQIFHENRSLHDKTESTSLNKVHFFIDGSWSMWGYVKDNQGKAGNTSYSKAMNELDALLIAQNQGIMNQYYKFGDFRDNGLEQSDIRDATRNASFYNHNLTQIDKMFEFIAKQKVPFKHAVVVTDGDIVVPNGKDFKVMIKGINQLISKGYEIELVGAQSSFNGKLSKTFNYANYNGKRPFYFYIISMGECLGEHTLKQLPGLESMQYANLTDRFFDQSLAKVSLIPSSRTQVKTKNTLNVVARKPYFKTVWDNSTDVRNSCGELITSITPHIKKKCSLNLKALNDVIISQKVYSVSQGKFIPIHDNLEICDDVRTIREKTLRFTLRFKNQPIHNDTLLYKISVLPKSTLTTPPEWITQWSTSNPTSKKDYGKTVNLKEFVQTIMYTKESLERQPIATIYLSMQEEEK